MSGFDILIIAQKGRLEYEAALFAASLRAQSPGFTGKLYIGEPQPGPLWPEDPRISDETRTLLARLDATPLPFENRHFGSPYPHANKIEAMAALPDDVPVVFFDTDTVVLGEIGELDLGESPTASMERENTWPVEETYGAEPGEVWETLFKRFGIDIAPTLNHDRPAFDWRHNLYFNAGLIFAPRAREFAQTMLDLMTAIQDDPPPCQPIYPWLDQIALPLAVAKHGGGRPEGDFVQLDGTLSKHYREIALLYATAPDAIIETLQKITAPNYVKKVIKQHEPFRRFIYQGAGPRARDLFDRHALPITQKPIRQRLKKNGLWIT